MKQIQKQVLPESGPLYRYVTTGKVFDEGIRLDDPRLEVLFSNGMSRDAEQVALVNYGFRFGARFKDYEIVLFGTKATAPPNSDAIDGYARYWKENDNVEKWMHIWMRRVGWIHTKAFLEELWHPVRGWETAIHNIHLVPPEHLVRDLKKLAKGILLGVSVQEQMSRGGRPEDTGSITERNKFAALEFVVNKGRYIHSTEGQVSKLDVARACGGRYGITGRSEYAGCKAIDRLIKLCDPNWTWRDDILPLIKAPPPSS